jgi:16S rRNA (guanine527-N7)-methyltransferase
LKVLKEHIVKAIEDLKLLPEFIDLKTPSDRCIELSRKYLNLLLFWNQTHDLIGPPKSIEDMLLVHFTDSLASFHVCNKDRENRKLRYMDIGTGAGIPGFFWHFLFEDKGVEIETILLEPREKRVHFMEEVIRELGLTNIIPIKERVDGLLKLKLDFVDIYTARALKLTDKDIKILKKLDSSKQPQILWLAGPETEVQAGWDLASGYSLVSAEEYGRRIYSATLQSSL